MQTSSSSAAFRPRARPAHRTRKDPEMPEIDVMITLTDDELDAVAGGQTASVSWTVGGSASGPTSATLTSSATGTTSVTGGLAPSASASLSGTFTSLSS